MKLDDKQALALAQAVRDACVTAALQGYENAKIAGLCHEGAWEVAMEAVRNLDLDALLCQRTGDSA